MTDYVELIGERSVRVIARGAAGLQAVHASGGTAGAGADSWNIAYDTEDQLAQILQRLRDADVAFAGGSAGWPPAAVAESLRDKNKLHGTIRQILWSGPGQEVIREG